MESLRDIKGLEELGYVGTTRGMEMEILDSFDWIEFYPLRLRGFVREFKWPSLLRNILAICELFIALPKILYIILKMRPTIILGTGGYTSFLPLFLGILLRIPTFILEPNVLPGLTNRLLAPWVDLIFLAHKSTRQFLNGNKSLVTGVPIRKDVLCAKSHPQRYGLFGLDPNKKTALVLGGSSGSQLLNEAVLRDREKIKELEEVQILLVTGKEEDAKAISLIFDQDEIDNIAVVPFVHEIGMAFRLANLVISRAGACTLAEVTALGLPSILVPWAKAVQNHQYINASLLEDVGASLVVNEESLANDQESIAKLIRQVLFNEKACKEMCARSYDLGKREAATQIKKEVKAFTDGK